MKNRILRHETLTSAPFLKLDAEAQALYLALLCHADDNGVMANDITEIAARCRPVSGRPVVTLSLDHLIKAGFLVQVDEYLVVAGFGLTQRPQRPRPQYFPEGLPDDVSEIVSSPPNHPKRQSDDILLQVFPEISPLKQASDYAVEDRPASNSPLSGHIPASMSVRPSPEQPMDEPIETVSRATWSARLLAYKNRGAWLKHYGPKPGQPGSLIPEDML